MPNVTEVGQIIQTVVECSVYLDPTEPGLTYPEILEACRRLDLRDGEVSDAIQMSGVQGFYGKAHYMPSPMTLTYWAIYCINEEPEYRNFIAFDFIAREFNELARDVGVRAARIDKEVLIERGRNAGIAERDLRAALTIMVMCHQLDEDGAVLSIRHSYGTLPIPSEQRQNLARPIPKPFRQRAYDVVKDIIERRCDGRPAQSEPLVAFSDRLADLGYGPFRTWWVQTVAEMQRADPQSSSVSVTVLAAAVIEGVLAFVVKHGRSLQLSVFKSSDFDRSPRTWKIEDLVNSAAQGPDAIIDNAMRQRILGTIISRQRIHAGRMLEEFPRGVPDLRPEEARDAKATAELVTRKVLDWLDRYPAVSAET